MNKSNFTLNNEDSEMKVEVLHIRGKCKADT